MGLELECWMTGFKAGGVVFMSSILGPVLNT